MVSTTRFCSLRKTQRHFGGSYTENEIKYMARKKLTQKMFRDWGRKGGLKNKAKGQVYFQEIGRQGAIKRWANNKKQNEKANIGQVADSECDRSGDHGNL